VVVNQYMIQKNSENLLDYFQRIQNYKINKELKPTPKYIYFLQLKKIIFVKLFLLLTKYLHTPM
jgi:hypothetical protein